MVQVFDKVKVLLGARVFSPDYPLGLTILKPFEVQVHRVLSAEQSPDGYGEVVTWRTPGNYDDKSQSWTRSASVVVTIPAAYP